MLVLQIVSILLAVESDEDLAHLFILAHMATSACIVLGAGLKH